MAEPIPDKTPPPVGKAVAATLERLRAEIAAATTHRLPPVAVLCRNYGVSPRTLTAAAAILRAQGVLRYYRGHGMEITERTPPPPPTSEKSDLSDRLYRSLKAEIVEGVRRSGESLPKLEYFVRERHMSNRGVARAYERLAGDDLVHREGRRWVVGSRPFRGGSLGQISPPVILVLEPRDGYWNSLSWSERTGRFCGEFMREVEKHGVATRFLACSPGSLFSTTADEIRDLVRKLGSRYLGSLLAGSPGDFPDCNELVSGLGLFRRPVALFNAGEDSPELKEHRFLYRPHFSEHASVDRAVSFLQRAGHRTIGYGYREGTPWERNRERLVRESAGRHGGITIVATPDYRTIMKRCDEDALHHNLGQLYEKRPVFAEAFELFLRNRPTGFDRARYLHLARKYRDRELLIPMRLIEEQSSQTLFNAPPVADYALMARLLVIAPSLTHMLAHDGLTAILAPHDRLAIRTWEWLRLAEIAVPDHLSLLSFDNYRSTQTKPISSVDFGAADLGYRSFHILLGDVPVRHDRANRIPSRPAVVNRGSVSAPRTHPIPFSFRKIVP